MTPTATATAAEPVGTETDDAGYLRREAPEALAVVDADYPDGHPWREGILRDLARFYRTGGFATRPRAAAILADAHERLATAAA